ncbi:glycoside hydrolase family 5 protein [Oerskovia sp. M15]
MHTDGSTIVDEAGNEVWLTGANWFGFNAGERVFHGLWSGNLESITRSMAERGINIVRVPISTELLLEWKDGQTVAAPNVNTSANPELIGMDNKEIFDHWLELCEKYGLKVMIDLHSATADNSGHVYPLWTHGEFTVEDFYAGWEWFADEYKDDDTIVAADLKNEPHGSQSETLRAKWDGSSDADNWRYVAEQAAAKILAINPHLLILVEGVQVYPKAGRTWDDRGLDDFHNTWWGGNLRGAADHPVDLGAHQDQLVYSRTTTGPWSRRSRGSRGRLGPGVARGRGVGPELAVPVEAADRAPAHRRVGRFPRRRQEREVDARSPRAHRRLPAQPHVLVPQPQLRGHGRSPQPRLDDVGRGEVRPARAVVVEGGREVRLARPPGALGGAGATTGQSLRDLYGDGGTRRDRTPGAHRAGDPERDGRDVVGRDARLDPSTDDRAVSAYDVYRNDAAGRRRSPRRPRRAPRSRALPATSYSFTVRARDAAGNVSALSGRGA